MWEEKERGERVERKQRLSSCQHVGQAPPGAMAVNALPGTIFLLGNEGISGHFSPSSSQVSVGLVLCVILAKQACQSLTFLSGACRPVMLLNLSLPGVFSALWEILNMWPKSVDIGMEVT